MARLIDADALKDTLYEVMDKYDGYDPDKSKIICGLMNADELINMATTIEAAPVVHGRWEGPFRVDVNHNGYKCSKCGFWGVPGWIACPKCATRMDGGGNA